MIPAEKIKWIIENIKPEGFGYDNLGLNTEHSCFGWGLIEGCGNDIEGFDLWKNVYYPLFLQRVIEAINRLDDSPHIIQNHLYTEVLDWEYESLSKWGAELKDHAKEEAILYIVDKLRSEE